MLFRRCDRCGKIGEETMMKWGYVRVYRPSVGDGPSESLEADLCLECVDTLMEELKTWPLESEEEHEEAEPVGD